MQTNGRSGYSDPEIYYHVLLSRMFQMEGDWEATAREMQKASDLARKIPPAMIREEVISQQVRVHLAFNRLAAAQEPLKAEGFSFESEFRFPELAGASGELVHSVTHPAGLLYNSALRVLLFRASTKHYPADLNRGLELAAQVLAGELQCKQTRIALETLLLRSQMYAALGDEPHSLADVTRALELAEPEGFISIFVEEGPPIAKALTTLLEHNLPGTARADYINQKPFIRNLLAAFPRKPQPEAEHGKQFASLTGDADATNESLSLVKPLTHRELEVLQLIAAGDSNQAIAHKLVITVSAVKKHAGHIFDKLSVNSRTQAVARPRQLGLIAAKS